MECLGRTLSLNTQSALEELHSNIMTSIRYEETTRVPYCLVNADKSFDIGLLGNVSQREFENNLIHETRHVTQMFLKYSHCEPKDANNKRMRMICDMITSLVLDYDVNEWMIKRNFVFSKKSINDKYEFYKTKLKKPPEKLAAGDYLDLIFQTVNLKGNISNSKFEFYCFLISKTNNDILVKANLIKDLFSCNDGTTPDGCAIIENSIINILDLPIYLATYNFE